MSILSAAALVAFLRYVWRMCEHCVIWREMTTEYKTINYLLFKLVWFFAGSAQFLFGCGIFM